MARDKQPPGFSHSPFKPLKGLSVSSPPKGVRVTPPTSPVPAAPVDDEELFAREMASLAVRPVAGADREGASPPASPSPTVPPADEGAEFLAALGTLDKSFHDELPAADIIPQARPRRMRQLERGTLKPSAELDLHGLTRDEALARTRSFLGHAGRQGWPVVLVVTGKGLHSSEGPVLRRAVEELLADSSGLVAEWGAAPRRFGGSGALAVFLKSAKQR